MHPMNEMYPEVRATARTVVGALLDEGIDKRRAADHLEDFIRRSQAAARRGRCGSRAEGYIREAARRGWDDAIEARALKASKKPEDVTRRLIHKLGELAEGMGRAMRDC